MHINFSLEGEDVVNEDQRSAFATVLRAVADALLAGRPAVVVTGFVPSVPVATGGPIGPSGVLTPAARTPLVTADKADPYLETEKPAKKAKAKKDESKVVPDSKDPAQTAIPGTEPSAAYVGGGGAKATFDAAAVPDADALRAIVNKYTNRFGLAKLRETVTAFGVKKLLDLTDAQKIEWAAARTAELAVPAEEEN